MTRTFLRCPWLGWAIAPFFLHCPATISLRAGTANAQIVPDGSLGAESSIVSSPAPNLIQIDGGATRGRNLFHSFQDFSIPAGRTALFDHATSIEHVFTRVTGGNISQIDGLLQANGTASLFLLNPNGIVFGPEARLNIGGSFFATTAESLNFDDGGAFGAIAPSAPLLTVNTPVGLQFGENPGSIVHRSQALRLVPLPPELPIPSNAGLEVAPGRSLALIGGDVFLENGNLTAPQGEVRLGSVAGPGIVTFATTPAGIEPNYEGIENFGAIELSGMATVNVSGAGGGTISLRGGAIDVREDANLLAVTFGDSDGRGIEVAGDRFLLQDDALISTATFGAGNGGDLTIRTTESVDLSGPGFADLQALLLSALVGSLDASDTTFGINVTSQGDGRAGTATIATRNFIMREGAFLTTSTNGSGMGGDAIVRAEAIEIDAAFLLSSTGLATTGDSGDIVLEAQTLKLVNGGDILAATLGSGAGGDVIVRAADLVEISGSPDGALFSSGVSTSSLFGDGPAGRIEIDARRIVVAEGGFVNSQSGAFFGITTISQGGPGNNVILKASESIEVRGSSANGQFTSIVSAESFGDAPAGDVVIETGQLVVEDGALLVVNGGSTPTAIAAGSAGGAGDAGTLEIVADTVRLENGGSLLASTVSGLGGNISIQTQDLQLRERGNIATDAGSSDGGNIAIAADTLVAFGNSDITANAEAGLGGRVAIEAAGIFGIQFRDFLTPDSDITATSALGAEFGGTVAINEPEVDPGSALVDLPENPIDAAELFARDPCQTGKGSQYAIVGRGGLPPNPLTFLQFDAIATEWASVPAGGASARRTQTERPHSDVAEEIVEATGWESDRDGNVVALVSVREAIPQANRAIDRESWHRRDRCSSEGRSPYQPPTDVRM